MYDSREYIKLIMSRQDVRKVRDALDTLLVEEVDVSRVEREFHELVDSILSRDRNTKRFLIGMVAVNAVLFLLDLIFLLIFVDIIAFGAKFIYDRTRLAADRSELKKIHKHIILLKDGANRPPPGFR